MRWTSIRLLVVLLVLLLAGCGTLISGAPPRCLVGGFWTEEGITREYSEAVIEAFGIKGATPSKNLLVYRRLDYLEAYCKGINAYRGNK